MKYLLLIIGLFLSSLGVSSQNLVQLPIEIEGNVKITYFKANFIIEDSIETVDFKADSNLWSMKDSNNIWILQIPYNSDYLIEIYNSEKDTYKYIQVNTTSNKYSQTLILPKINFKNRERICIYFDTGDNIYKYFTTTEGI